MKPVTAMFVMLAACAAAADMAQEAKVGDVTCSVILPITAWRTPSRGLGETTAIPLALQVCNGTAKTLFFSCHGTITPTLRGEAGKNVTRSGYRRRLIRPTLADYRMLRPGESTTFAIDARLYWQQDSLVLESPDGSGGVWEFKGLAPGAYELGITYASLGGADTIFGDKGELTVSEDKVWKGQATTPFTKVSIHAGAPPQTAEPALSFEKALAIAKEEMKRKDLDNAYFVSRASYETCGEAPPRWNITLSPKALRAPKAEPTLIVGMDGSVTMIKGR